ncbi:hypothetical protein G6F56_011368 [Rhizopus delemar]|nr:hypothetical protein G6F56_011368 [Rhizopus delemar]
MHLIAHVIGKHIYALITAKIDGQVKAMYVEDNGEKNRDTYTFKCSKEDIKQMGEKSWDDIFAKVDGTRPVDWLDFLLHAVPTVVAPFIQRQDARDALLGLVRACNLSLQWRITDQMLREMST